MKNILPGLMILTCLAGPLLAQNSYINIGGGVSFPVAPKFFTDNWSPGANMTLGFSELHNDHLGTLYSFNANGFFEEDGSDAGSAVFITDFSAAARFHALPGESPVSPFLTGGLGVGLFRTSRFSDGVAIGDFNSETGVEFQIGFTTKVAPGISYSIVDRELYVWAEWENQWAFPFRNLKDPFYFQAVRAGVLIYRD